MAINKNPYFAPGQDLTPEQLALMLALQGDFARNLDALQEYQTGYGESSSWASAPQGTLPQSWALPGQGRFAPTLEYVPATYKQQLTVNGDNTDFQPTDEIETPAYYRIRQGENDSFTRASRSHIWDPTTGQYLGRESSGGLWSDMAPIAAMALAAYGGSLAAGASGAASGGAAATTGAGTAAAGTGGGLNWGAIGSAAAKNAAINAGMTLANGGDLGDAFRSGALGAVTGGVGGGMAAYGVNPMLAQGTTGALGAAARGGDGSDILRGAAGGAISGGIGQLGQNYGWSPEATAAARGAAGAAVGGGDGRDILRGAATGYAGSAINNSARGNGYLSGQDGLQTEPGFFAPGGQGYDAGGGMDYFSSTFGDGSGYTENAFGDTFGNTPINAQDYWGFDPSIYDMGGGYDSQQGSGIDWGSLLSKGVGWLMQGGDKDDKGASPLAMLLGGLLGAQGGKDQQQTSSRDPWAPMQPYLLGLAEDGRKLYNQYTQQPFSPAQQTAYNNVGGLLDVLNLNAGGLLQGMQANATGKNQFVRGQPRQLIGSAPIDGMAFQPGRLGNFGTRRG